MAFFVRHGEFSHPIKTSKPGAIRKLDHGFVNQTGIEMKQTCIFIYIYIYIYYSEKKYIYMVQIDFVVGSSLCGWSANADC